MRLNDFRQHTSGHCERRLRCAIDHSARGRSFLAHHVECASDASTRAQCQPLPALLSHGVGTTCRTLRGARWRARTWLPLASPFSTRSSHRAARGAASGHGANQRTSTSLRPADVAPRAALFAARTTWHRHCHELRDDRATPGLDRGSRPRPGKGVALPSASVSLRRRSMCPADLMQKWVHRRVERRDKSVAWSAHLRTVVEVYTRDAIAVEFVAASGRPQTLVTLHPNDVRDVHDDDLVSVRPTAGLAS
jgi:hypothetical protein